MTVLGDSNSELAFIGQYLGTLESEKLTLITLQVDGICSEHLELNNTEMKSLMTYIIAKYGASALEKEMEKIYSEHLGLSLSNQESKARLFTVLLRNIVQRDMNVKNVVVIYIGEERNFKRGRGVDFLFMLDTEIFAYRSFNQVFTKPFLDGPIGVFSRVQISVSRSSEGNPVIQSNKPILLEEDVKIDVEAIIGAVKNSPSFQLLTPPIEQTIAKNPYDLFYCQGLVGMKVDKYNFEFHLDSDKPVDKFLLLSDENMQSRHLYFLLSSVGKYKRNGNAFVLYPLISIDLTESSLQEPSDNDGGVS